jgi:hypothetical protein
LRRDNKTGATDKIDSVGFNHVQPLEGADVTDTLFFDSERDIRLKRRSTPTEGTRYEINFKPDPNPDGSPPEPDHRRMFLWGFLPDGTPNVYASSMMLESINDLLYEAEQAEPAARQTLDAPERVATGITEAQLRQLIQEALSRHAEANTPYKAPFTVRMKAMGRRAIEAIKDQL